MKNSFNKFGIGFILGILLFGAFSIIIISYIKF